MELKIYFLLMFYHIVSIFWTNRLNSVKIKYSRFKGIEYKRHISLKIRNPNQINGKVTVYNKKLVFKIIVLK